MKLYEKINAIQNEILEIAVERFDETHGLFLALITGLNILKVGSPGTAKSMLSSRLLEHIEDGKKFQRLLTVFSTPEELFGPPDMALFKEKRIFQKNISGMLPEADIGFIDEVFKANPGILNSLLEVMNERMFSDGARRIPVPLLILIGASNEIPDADDKLGALYDRFHLKYEVRPINEPGNFMKMLELPDPPPPPKTKISKKEIMVARMEVSEVQIPSEIIMKLAQLRNELSRDGISVTDRTYKASLKLLKAEAYLKGQQQVQEDHMDILRHMFWTDPKDARKVYMKILNQVNPEKEVIIDKYEELMELARKVFAEKDPNKQIDKGLEAAGKFKQGLEIIRKKQGEMQEKGKDISEIQIMMNDIMEQHRRIFSEACGMNPNTLI
jgi:MoxR-like ATPase